MRTPSIMRRSIAANTLLALVVLSGAAIASYFVLQAALHRSLDDALENRASFAVGLADEMDEEALTDRLARLGIRARVEARDGEVFVAEPELLRVSQVAVPGQARNWRSIERTLPTGAVLTLDVSADGVDRTLARFRTIGLLIGAAAVGATALLTAATNRITLSPLRAMASTARVITSGEPTARAQPDDPHTEIGQVAAAFDEMVDHLQAANAALEHSEAGSRQLVADVAHQLRTPLAGVLATTEILRDRTSQPESQDLLDAAHNAAGRAAALAERLLHLAAHDLPVEAAASCDATEVIERSATAIRALHRDLEVTTTRPARPVLVALSRRELEDAVGNLLDNAARHAVGHINIVLDSTDDHARIAIHDDGPGVRSDQVEQAFQRFVSLDDHRGSGLGLPIAQAAVRRRGGDLTWASDHFLITVPTA